MDIFFVTLLFWEQAANHLIKKKYGRKWYRQVKMWQIKKNIHRSYSHGFVLSKESRIPNSVSTCQAVIYYFVEQFMICFGLIGAKLFWLAVDLLQNTYQKKNIEKRIKMSWREKKSNELHVRFIIANESFTWIYYVFHGFIYAFAWFWSRLNQDKNRWKNVLMYIYTLFRTEYSLISMNIARKSSNRIFLEEEIIFKSQPESGVVT